MARSPRLGGFPDEVVNECREIFEPRMGKPLSDLDCQEIANNVTGFFEVLKDWHRRDLELTRRTATSEPCAGDLARLEAPSCGTEDR